MSGLIGGYRPLTPLRTVGSDGIGQVNMLLCPLLTGANHPGLLSV